MDFKLRNGTGIRQKQPVSLFPLILVAFLIAGCAHAAVAKLPTGSPGGASAASSTSPTTPATIIADVGGKTWAPTASATSGLTATPAGAPTAEPTPPSSPTPEANTDLRLHLVGSQVGHKAVYYTSQKRSHVEIWRLDLDTLKTSLIYASDEEGVEVQYLSPSPSGQLLAFTVFVRRPVDTVYLARSAIILLSTDGSQARTIAETKGTQEYVANPQWSANGTFVAYARVHLNFDALGPIQLHLFNPKDGTDQLATSQGAMNFAWSPDGTQIALGEASIRNALSVLTLESGEQQVLWQEAGLNFLDQVWQPGGDQIAVAVAVDPERHTEDQDGLYLVSATTGQRRKLIDGRVYGIHWSPDGKLLSYCGIGQVSRLWLFDFEKGTNVMMSNQDIAAPGSSPWSIQGNALLLALEDKPRRMYSISLMTVQDRQVIPLASVDSIAPYPAW